MRKLLTSNREVKSFNIEVKAVNEEDYTIEGVFSTAAVDRHGDVVVQAGWNTEKYMQNPVVLWCHDNYQFPLAQMTILGVDSNGNLAGKMKFAVDEYEMAATAFRLMKGKFLRAFSAGFINNVYEIDQNSEVVKLIENELLEISVVNVPANPEALAKMKKMSLIQDGEGTQESATLETDQAVETLSKSDKDTIRAAIKALTEALNDEAEPDNQAGKKVEHSQKGTGTKKIPVKTINRAIRALLGVKKAKV